LLSRFLIRDSDGDLFQDKNLLDGTESNSMASSYRQRKHRLTDNTHCSFTTLVRKLFLILAMKVVNIPFSCAWEMYCPHFPEPIFGQAQFSE